MSWQAHVPHGAAPIAAWNLASRVTGFVRVLAVGAALGTTYAGNTYQSANLVSNLMFELLAAGVLSSVLVPAFVARLGRGGRAEVSALAGAILGVLLVGLGVVTLVGMLAGPWIMRLLTAAVADRGVREAEVELGSFLLWFLLPQLLLYAVGAVATGLLHADQRFAAAAAAPLLNNAIVIATMTAFWLVRDGERPSLDLPLGEKVLLGAGTTAGVLAMSLLPALAARRAGLRLRPRWQPRHPDLRALARQGAWAAGWLALAQVLIGVTLVLANRVEGGVVAYQIAFTFVLLPHALFAHPIFTSLYPRLSADALAGDRTGYQRRLAGGLRVTALLVGPASLLLAVIARPLLDLVAVGALAEGGGPKLVGRVLTAYAVGLFGYSCFHLLTRASYARGDTRAPTLVHLAATAAGVALMVVWSNSAEGIDRVVTLGWAHSIVMLGAAAALFVSLQRSVRHEMPVRA